MGGVKVGKALYVSDCFGETYPIQCMPMADGVHLLLTPAQASEWIKEAGAGERRRIFSPHAELRMRQRRIGRRQVLETLRGGSISEPLHKDVRGDWRCNVSWFYAGARLTVGLVFKIDAQGVPIVVATYLRDDMEAMLKYEDCGLSGIWLANGFRYENIEGQGRCLEIDDIDGLHRAIGHHLVHYRKRLTGSEIRFLRVEMGMSQKRLADSLGVDEQTVSLWERSRRRPTVAAERVLRLLYLERMDGTTKVAELIAQWNDTDRQEEERRRVFEETGGGWRMAA